MQSPTHFPYCCYIRGGSRNSGMDSQGTERQRQVEVTRLLASISHQSAAQSKSSGKTGMGCTGPRSYPRSTGEGGVNRPTRSPSKRWLLLTKSPAKNRLHQESAWKDCQGFINTHTHGQRAASFPLNHIPVQIWMFQIQVRCFVHIHLKSKIKVTFFWLAVLSVKFHLQIIETSPAVWGRKRFNIQT